jgi:glucose-1-phosphate thymidylyltransferase
VPMSFTGVILAAGDGRRMEALGVERPKACFPVCNRPLLHYHLDLLMQLGVRDVVIVVGHQAKQVEELAKAYEWPHGADASRLRFVHQTQRRGIAHALMCAKPMVQTDGLIVILGDIYFVPDRLTSAIEQMEGSGEKLAAILSIRPVANKDLIRKECTVQFDAAGFLVDIEEKPKEPWNELKACGMYFFRRSVFDAIVSTPPSALRGEVEITDSIKTLVRNGLSVGKAETVKWDVNLNHPADLLLTNLVELRRRGATKWIAEDAIIEDGVTLDEVVVGPRAHVNAGARLHRCVVLEDVAVPRQIHREGCILGRDFNVESCLPGILPMLQMFNAKEMADG